jgi:hypothetical protein
MKRRMFATAVVLVVMATPLFGAQAAPSAPPAKGAVAQQPAAKPEQKKPVAEAKKSAEPAQTAAAKAAPQKPSSPAAAAPTPKPAAPATAQAPASSSKPAVPAAAKAVPASPKPAATAPATASKAPAAPAAPTLRLNAPTPKSDARPATLTSKASAPVLTSGVGLSPVQEKLVRNKELTRELQTRLSGEDVVSAAEGFKDLPQFVAAAHVSHNLRIPFAALKAKLLAAKRTGLRQAIQELRPAASAAIEAQRAQYDAGGMIRATEQATAAAEAAQAQSKAKPATPAKPKSSSSQ